jgi:hypothetical protein
MRSTLLAHFNISKRHKRRRRVTPPKELMSRIQNAPKPRSVLSDTIGSSIADELDRSLYRISILDR